MASPTPVKIIQVDAVNYAGREPRPLVVVGNIGPFDQQKSVTDVTTPDATDEATAAALANALKVKTNQLLATLRAAGVIMP